MDYLEASAGVEEVSYSIHYRKIPNIPRMTCFFFVSTLETLLDLVTTTIAPTLPPTTTDAPTLPPTTTATPGIVKRLYICI